MNPKGITVKYETGPWRACLCGCGNISSVPYAYSIAVVNKHGDNGEPIDPDTVGQTMRMIEAAPDMLEFLRGLIVDEGNQLELLQQAMALVERIDNPPEATHTQHEQSMPDHRSPFEKMTTVDVPPNTTGEWTHDWSCDGLYSGENIHDADGNSYEAVCACNIHTGTIVQLERVATFPPRFGREVVVSARPPLRITNVRPGTSRSPSQPSIASGASK